MRRIQAGQAFAAAQRALPTSSHNGVCSQALVVKTRRI